MVIIKQVFNVKEVDNKALTKQSGRRQDVAWQKGKCKGKASSGEEDASGGKTAAVCWVCGDPDH